MASIRAPIKSLSENQRRWRERIRQENGERIKLIRQEKINKFREDKLAQYQICNEIDAFNKANEETLRMQGTFDVDQLIEESIMQEYELEEYLQQEQVEYCVNCQNEVLTYQQTDILLCSNCGFYTTKDCFEKTILPLLHRHALDCQGKIGFCLEPGTDNTLFANCDICDLWDILYM